MSEGRLPRIALLFAQFSAYHVDRCEAVARRMTGRCEVLAVEVATTSETYAWNPSGAVAGTSKLTLFPGRSYDAIGHARKFRAQFAALRRCRTVFIGIGYNEPDIIVLSWALRVWGVQVVMLSESKFDDRPRRAGFELGKALLLGAYHGAIVGARRQLDYFRYLGFRRRSVLPGYDTVSIDRVLAEGGGVPAPHGVSFAERKFVFVGRFVAKKNLFTLLEGYARYVDIAGPGVRRLVLAGGGADESALRETARSLGVADLVEFPGFLDSGAIARLLAGSLALVLPSIEEQWGLVVNEAQALGLPVIVSTEVGSRDALVRNLVNGYVIEPCSVEGIAAAMANLAGNAQLWAAMARAAQARAWLGDTERLADAVETILDLAGDVTTVRVAQFRAALEQ